MSDPGRCIGEGEAFGDVKVYVRMNGSDPVYTVAFKNREVFPVWYGVVFLIPFLGLVFGSLAGGEDAYYYFLALLIWLGGAVIWGIGGHKTNCRIELDYGAMVLRVIKNGKKRFQHSMAPNFKLTVDDHPDTPLEQQKRQGQGIGEIQKQHTLFGWFGIGQAQRHDLLHRYEWPKKYSLQEVQVAVYWARDFEGKRPKASAANDRAIGMAPPLD